ncbi:BPSS1780 family membrane protein [Pigmentiphaga litoralis]|uniref:BPSS1780 family membrane protein n=1 Tax=Pigmentiphaga litoralis TaxID=516702 RepID=UPI003B42B96D
MQAASLPMSAGWHWVRDGFGLFKRQPIAMFTWALTIGFLVLVATMIPPIGPLLFVTLMPVVTVMTLVACRQILAGKAVMPLRLFLILKTPGLAKRLFGMGAVYVVIVLLAGMVAFLPFMDTLRDALQGVTDDDLSPVLVAMRTPIILFAIFYVSVAAMFWHAPVLVAWHNLSLRKALFFSAVACWRNKGAFIVYGLVWFGAVAGLELLGGLLEGIGLPQGVAGLVQMPLNFFAAAVLYCSFYPAYESVFGEPDTPEAQQMI